MMDFIRWLIVVEVIGLAFLPVALWLFRQLPDRGYVLAKLLGLLGVTYIVWLAGEAAPIAGSALLPAAVVIAVGAAGWWFWWARTLATVQSIARVAIVEECLFLAALIAWSMMRAFLFHPGIGHTEQYMDLTFLQGSIHSSSYPPYDAWMSGHSINYYYFGYLMMAMLVKLSGIAPAIGYNLALSTVFAFTLTGAYAVGYALSRRLAWAALAPLFVGVLGNWHAVLVQLPSGQNPAVNGWFWESTRVVGGSNTINEFPYFSFILGDLHPHVMALPVTILAIALGINFLHWQEPIRLTGEAGTLLRLAIAAVCIGSLYAINSWDFPTYLLVIAGCLVAGAYLTDNSSRWWRAPAGVIPVLAVAGLVAFAPFYLQFKAPTHGIGLVSTPSNPLQFLQVFGLFLLAVVILLVSYGLILQPADSALTTEEDTAEAGSSWAGAGAGPYEVGAARSGDTILFLAAAVAVMIILGLRFQLWTLDILLAVTGSAGIMLRRVLNTEEPNKSDATALLLIIVGCLVLAATEVFYLRDVFDGGALYRMNTVFKFYYQGWTLLGIAAAYGVYRSWVILRKHFALAFGALALAVLAVGIAGGAVYTVAAPQSAMWGGSATSLNGMSILAENHPSDAAAISWLTTHVSGTPVVLEAGNGGDYLAAFGRVAAFSGLPTVMGWSGHEYQWRGNDPEIGVRKADVTTIYTTASIATAERLLRRYHVRYVFVGDAEQGIAGARLRKFATFMKVAFRSGKTRIYHW